MAHWAGNRGWHLFEARDMAERQILNTWKEIAAYLSRGVRTAQRWEISYKLPVHRPNGDAQTVYAFSDEIDAWLERSKPRNVSYIRPTFIVVDLMTPGALSDLKLSIEQAKFNVLTSYTSSEVIATAEKYEVDGFVVDAVLLDKHPAELGRELRKLYPSKIRVLVGEDCPDVFDACIPPGNINAVVDWLIAKFGRPEFA